MRKLLLDTHCVSIYDQKCLYVFGPWIVQCKKLTLKREGFVIESQSFFFFSLFQFHPWFTLARLVHRGENQRGLCGEKWKEENYDMVLTRE